VWLKRNLALDSFTLRRARHLKDDIARLRFSQNRENHHREQQEDKLLCHDLHPCSDKKGDSIHEPPF
jgi:hypothetical protein